MHKILSWTAVVLWMLFIFCLSYQPANESNQMSTGITEVIIQTTSKIVPKAELSFHTLNHFVRKSAHFFIYFVLGILTINALRRIGWSDYRCTILALTICVLYAASDELHQLFIPGRSAELRDIFIDSTGAYLGIGFYLMIGHVMK
jgi:VanZ family protein